MKNLLININLYGQKIGVALWNEEKETASFQYDNKFLQTGLDVSPITMPLNKSRNIVYSFPLNRGKCFNGLPGLIADSLPDKYGTEQINAYFSSKGIPIEEISPLDRLCYIGKRGMGA